MVNEKIRVGQVLKNIYHSNDRYKITKVGDRGDTLYAWGKLVKKDGSLGEEGPFGSLNKDGLPNSWGPHWEIEVQPPKTQTSSTAALEDDSSKMMHFFRTSSHPENCGKCGAPKPCSYHP